MIEGRGVGARLVRRYLTMTPSERFWASLHLAIDTGIILFFLLMVDVGLTRDHNAFFVWIPLLCILIWGRWKQTRRRWSS